MLPEDRLDALLSSRGALPRPYTGLSDDDAAFGPLLAAAAQLVVLTEARPSPTFAQALENRILAHAATLAVTDTATQIEYNSSALPGTDVPTQPSALAFASAPTLPRVTPSTHPPKARHQRGIVLLRSRFPRLLPQAIAAALVLMLGVGALTAAAASGPGSFLFPLRRFEQGVQLGISGSPADRFKLHLAYAGDALTALDGMHGNTNRDKSPYAQALATLSDEERAAEKELANVSDSAQHDDLAAQLQAFKTRATHDLYAALSPDAALSWQNRVATTQVLDQLGAQVPHIDVVRISRVDDTTRSADTGMSSGRSWKVTISGTGFTPGATLTINGHAAGTVTQLSPTQIVALVKTDDSALPPATIGIQEPDGTAAQATHSTPGNDDRAGGSSATATPGGHSGDGDSHTGDGHGGKGSGQGGTPVPTPTPTRRPGT
jgi:hypothetical protein